MLLLENGAENLKELGIPDHFLTEIDYPGEVRGKVKGNIADFLGIDQAPVIAVATHDTGSAVAVPALEGNYAFLSSGTWSDGCCGRQAYC